MLYTYLDKDCIRELSFSWVNHASSILNVYKILMESLVKGVNLKTNHITVFAKVENSCQSSGPASKSFCLTELVFTGPNFRAFFPLIPQ